MYFSSFFARKSDADFLKCVAGTGRMAISGRAFGPEKSFNSRLCAKRGEPVLLGEGPRD